MTRGWALKWKNHTSIARAIARELNLPPMLEEALVRGSTEPDRYNDMIADGRHGRFRRVSHHSPSAPLMMGLVWGARSCVLRGDEIQGCRELGRSLHYIQDKSVPYSTRRKHDRMEQALGERDIDLEAIRRGVEISRPSPRFVRRVIHRVRPSGNHGRIISRACQASASVAASVLLHSNPPPEIIRGIRRSRKKCLVMTTILFAVLVLGAFGYVEISDPILLLVILILLPLAALSLVFYKRKGEEGRWFGVH